jgi:microsomal dipeptidase-like Zn-dependent dipeptidase
LEDLDLDLSKETSEETQQKIIERFGTPLQTDLPRLNKGLVGGLVWSMFSNCSDPLGLEKILQQLSVISTLEKKYPDKFKVITSPSQIKPTFKEKKIVSILGIEGGQVINSNLKVLRGNYL